MAISQPLVLRGDEWMCPGCEGTIQVTDTPGVHTDPRNPQDDGAEVSLPSAALVHKDGCMTIAGMCAGGHV